MGRAWKIDHLLKWTNFHSKKTICCWYWGPGAKIKELFALIPPIFWDISSRIWQRIYANRTNRISPSQNRLPQFGIRKGFFSIPEGKASLFPPPKKNKQNGKALGPLKHLDPRQGATPKDVDGTSEVQQCIDIPWKETNEEGTRYSHDSRQSTKDPWCFWESFCFEKKVRRFVFLLGGGPGVEGVEKCFVWGRM